VRQQFERFLRNLSWWLSLTLLTVPFVKNLKFWNPKTAAAVILKNRHISAAVERFRQLLSAVCVHMNWKVHVACNLNHVFENKGLVKVACSHVRVSEVLSRQRYCRPLMGSDSLANSDSFDDRKWPLISFTYCWPFQKWFLPLNTMPARYMLSSCVRPSVCLRRPALY